MPQDLCHFVVSACSDSLPATNVIHQGHRDHSLQMYGVNHGFNTCKSLKYTLTFHGHFMNSKLDTKQKLPAKIF